jgi:hypothetical protein
VSAERGGRRPDPDDQRSAEEKAAAARIKHQASWVDLQLRQAMARGEFDDLPGYGKPIADLTGEHDPDWWVKRLIEREQITGVLPPSLQLRKEDAELDGQLDRISTEKEVRRAVEEFNRRVHWALYRPSQGPPMITPKRDPDLEVERWRERHDRRVAAQRAARGSEEQERARRRRRWFRR